MTRLSLSVRFGRSMRFRETVFAMVPALGLAVALNASAAALELPHAQCASGANLDASIEACSTIIQAEHDRRNLSLAHYNRALWYLKKEDYDHTLSDLTEAIRFDPGFAAALTRRGLVYEHYNDAQSAQTDFAACLKTPERSPLDRWAHATARERLAAIGKPSGTTGSTEPTTAVAAATPTATATDDSGKKSLTKALEECNSRPAVAINLRGIKGDIQLDHCYRGREHLACTVTALLNEANSIKQDLSEVIAADYPNVKTLEAICKMTSDRLSEHSRAILAFQERWKVLRKEYSARVDCTNNVEDSLRNLSLADMSHAADIVKAMIESVRSDLAAVSTAQKDVLNIADKADSAQKAIATIQQVRSAVCQ
jgi:tetratricopeptide (TPR) repeat protein